MSFYIELSESLFTGQLEERKNRLRNIHSSTVSRHVPIKLSPEVFCLL